MMEFLLFLRPQTLEVYQMISQKVRIYENTPVCRRHDIFGWFDSRSKTMTICTEKIKSDALIPELEMNQTILHEAVHVAQSCKNSNGNIYEFGIPASSMPLARKKKNDLDDLVFTYGKKHRRLEHEAFWLEDKPERVKYVVKKYCF
jgi:hypothetical protein